MSSFNPIIRILVSEDLARWRDIVRRELDSHFGDNVEIVLAGDIEETLAHINSDIFDLITVDLKQPSKAKNPSQWPGISLLEAVRDSSSRNKDCGLIVLSGYATIENQREAVIGFKVDDFIQKSPFDCDDFIEIVQKTLLRSLLRKARRKAAERCQLIIRYNRRRWLGGELNSPRRNLKIEIDNSTQFYTADIEKAADEINYTLLEKKSGRWRSQAKNAGLQLYQRLISDPKINSLLTSGRECSKANDQPLYIQFSGKPQGLRIPFELMYDSDYLVFDHLITRSMLEGDHKAERFFEFVTHHWANESHESTNKEPLRVLVVGVNAAMTAPDGSVTNEQCEKEAHMVAEIIERNLRLLNIPSKVVRKIGAEATCENVQKELVKGCHLLHFAGHADHNSTAEESAIYLFDGALTAVALKLLLSRSGGRFVFLSCCLGAHSGSKVGKGDFLGFLDAISKAGVPAVLGYRWLLDDYSALFLAQYFYEALFRTFCIAESLFMARTRAAYQIGRDNDIWASPILLLQIP